MEPGAMAGKKSPHQLCPSASRLRGVVATLHRSAPPIRSSSLRSHPSSSRDPARSVESRCRPARSLVIRAHPAISRGERLDSGKVRRSPHASRYPLDRWIICTRFGLFLDLITMNYWIRVQDMVLLSSCTVNLWYCSCLVFYCLCSSLDMGYLYISSS